MNHQKNICPVCTKHLPSDDCDEVYCPVTFESEIKELDFEHEEGDRRYEGYVDGPGEEDGPWADGWEDRCSKSD